MSYKFVAQNLIFFYKAMQNSNFFYQKFDKNNEEAKNIVEIVCKQSSSCDPALRRQWSSQQNRLILFQYLKLTIRPNRCKDIIFQSDLQILELIDSKRNQILYPQAFHKYSTLPNYDKVSFSFKQLNFQPLFFSFPRPLFDHQSDHIIATLQLIIFARRTQAMSKHSIVERHLTFREDDCDDLTDSEVIQTPQQKLKSLKNLVGKAVSFSDYLFSHQRPRSMKVLSETKFTSDAWSFDLQSENNDKILSQIQPMQEITNPFLQAKLKYLNKSSSKNSSNETALSGDAGDNIENGDETTTFRAVRKRTLKLQGKLSMGEES